MTMRAVDLVIREAALPGELPTVRGVYNANRERPATPERFDWAYLRNPLGRARAWLAIDQATGEAVGCGAVHPRRATVAGTRVEGWTTGDLSVHHEYRRHGLGLRLRQAAKAEIDAGASAFLYTHPNASAVSVHVRVGNAPLGRMVRRVKLLRSPVGPGPLRAASALPLRLLGLDGMVRIDGEIDHVTSGPLGPEFEELHTRVAPALGVAVERSGTYLAWRFLECPTESCAMLTLRRRGRLAGFLVYADKGDYVAVKDWLVQRPQDFDMLVVALVRHARAGAAAWVSVTALDTHPHLPRLRRLGFLPKAESIAAMAYAPAASPWREVLLDGRRWYMTAGDHDV
jgi:GNAT superfamily N-acetyltransferase